MAKRLSGPFLEPIQATAFNEAILRWIIVKNFMAKCQQKRLISLRVIMDNEITQFCPQNALINRHEKALDIQL
jgi:hypothetical protein